MNPITGIVGCCVRAESGYELPPSHALLVEPLNQANAVRKITTPVAGRIATETRSEPQTMLWPAHRAGHLTGPAPGEGRVKAAAAKGGVAQR